MNPFSARLSNSNRFTDPFTALGWAMDLSLLILSFFSASTLVFLRTRLGYRQMHPIIIGAVFLTMMLFSGAAGLTSYQSLLGGFATPRTSGGGMPALAWLALLYLALAIFHRRKGWKLIFTDQWHSMSRGDSHLAKLLPMREDYVQRFVEPFLCLLIGLIIMVKGSYLLGWWIAFSGTSLGIMEALIYDKQLNDMLDRHDARVEMQNMREVDAAVKAGGKVAAQPVARTRGVPVTVAPELQELLDRDIPDPGKMGPTA